MVAASNGIAGVIAPDGSVLDRTERRTQDLLVETVDLKSGSTPGLGIGTALHRATPFVTVVGVLWGIVLHRRARRGAASSGNAVDTADHAAQRRDAQEVPV